MPACARGRGERVRAGERGRTDLGEQLDDAAGEGGVALGGEGDPVVLRGKVVVVHEQWVLVTIVGNWREHRVGGDVGISGAQRMEARGTH